MILTLYDLFDLSTKKFLHKNFLGSRELLEKISPKVKKFGPDIQWETFSDVREKALSFGAALRGAGLQPGPKKTSLEKFSGPYSLAIFEDTCAEWLLGALGAFTQSISVTTIYATLGMDAVVDAINDGVIKALLCNQANVNTVLSRISEMPTLKTIVYTQYMIEPSTSFQPKVPSGISVVKFEDFIASGNTSAYPPSPPEPETCAVIMYTSGSTGKPKGVVIKHSNMVAAIAGLSIATHLEETDVYLGYLPLAHILELTAELTCLLNGATVTYADPKTLTSSGSKPIGALEHFSPTCMAGVPKIYDVIRKGAQTAIDKGSAIQKAIVATAFASKNFAMKHGYDTPLFNLLVFKKFKSMVGGNLRMCLSGGGPLSEEIQEFIRTAFGVPIVQGYGLTETIAACAVQALDDMRPQIAGAIVPINEVKLVSCSDITDKFGKPYLSSDRVDSYGNPIFGRGEIQMKGPQIALGYYMMPEKTAEDFGSDGFFHSGDIGQFMSDGSIRIIDRKKNLVKLKGGEYIAIELMEMAYSNSVFVDPIAGGLTCYGDGDMDRPIVIMHISPPAAKAWANENEVPYDLEALKKNKAFYEAVMADLKKQHKDAGLTNIEKVVAVGFASDPWTPESGCLTAANKLNRKAIFEKEKIEFEGARKKAIF